jgi:hypothetical protein
VGLIFKKKALRKHKGWKQKGYIETAGNLGKTLYHPKTLFMVS